MSYREFLENKRVICQASGFIGMELKRSYWNQAIKNLKNAEIEYKSQNLTLFDLEGVQ